MPLYYPYNLRTRYKNEIWLIKYLIESKFQEVWVVMNKQAIEAKDFKTFSWSVKQQQAKQNGE